jgi:hypothetical protein
MAPEESHMNTQLPMKSIVVGMLAMALSPPAWSDSVTIVADRDSTIYSEADDKANGSGQRLFAGRTDGGDLRRCLVHFDLATAGIPAGSTVTSASLRLYMSRTQAGNTGVSLRPVTTDWGEGASDPGGQEGGGDSAEDGDSTWVYTFYNENNPSSGPEWSSAGGDFGSASATTTVGGNGFYTWGSTGGMVSDAQGWLDNAATNFGWILVGNEGSDKTAKRFDSRQNSDSANWPRLTVVFDPPAVDGACCFPDGTCLVLSAGDCNSQGGVFQTAGSTCPGVTCPVIVGACCFDDSSCTVVTETICLGGGGAYQGDGTTCTTDLCPLVLEPFVDPLPIPPPHAAGERIGGRRSNVRHRRDGVSAATAPGPAAHDGLGLRRHLPREDDRSPHRPAGHGHLAEPTPRQSLSAGGHLPPRGG